MLIMKVTQTIKKLTAELKDQTYRHFMLFCMFQHIRYVSKQPVSLDAVSKVLSVNDLFDEHEVNLLRIENDVSIFHLVQLKSFHYANIFDRCRN